jgi:multidrug efflux pump subunit AcrA (membrane-fusion protein)
MQAQALLDQAQINLGYTEIRSPIDGRIGLAVYTVGNLVSPSSGTLATIVSQDPIYVIFQASERDVLDYGRKIAEAPDKSPHATVHIWLPNGSMYPHPGVTEFLDVQVDPRTDTVAVRARLPNPDGVLIPGGIVGVSVERGAPRSALTVPQSASSSIRPAATSCSSTRRRRSSCGGSRPLHRRHRRPQGGRIVIVEGIQARSPRRRTRVRMRPFTFGCPTAGCIRIPELAETATMLCTT